MNCGTVEVTVYIEYTYIYIYSKVNFTLHPFILMVFSFVPFIFYFNIFENFSGIGLGFLWNQVKKGKKIKKL